MKVSYYAIVTVIELQEFLDENTWAREDNIIDNVDDVCQDC